MTSLQPNNTFSLFINFPPFTWHWTAYFRFFFSLHAQHLHSLGRSLQSDWVCERRLVLLLQTFVSRFFVSVSFLSRSALKIYFLNVTFFQVIFNILQPGPVKPFSRASSKLFDALMSLALPFAVLAVVSERFSFWHITHFWRFNAFWEGFPTRMTDLSASEILILLSCFHKTVVLKLSLTYFSHMVLCNTWWLLLSTYTNTQTKT